MQSSLKPMEERERRKCPYLDTVNRKVLDFDLEKECSVCLSHQNVYICLVCGVYLQGRGEQTHAFTHSVENDHHVFLNLSTKKFYCIPDNYEIIDHSLDDIKMALDPEFTPEEIKNIDKNNKFYSTPSGDVYLPGVMGMNVIGKADYINVVVSALSHVGPLRDFFLNPSNYAYTDNPLVHSFGILIRKLWSCHRFRSNVSPHEFVNEVIRSSKGKFSGQQRSDAIEFLRWLVGSLNQGLKSKQHKISVFEQCFKGRLEITTRRYSQKQSVKRSHDALEGVETEDSTRAIDEEFNMESSVRVIDTFMLSLDLPPIPVYSNSNKETVVQEIPLLSLLAKYDGVTTTKDVWNNTEYIYRILKLPRYLIFTVNRITKNEFFYEKDTTIVQFPVKNLSLQDFFFPEARPATKDIVMKMSETPLKLFIQCNGETIEKDSNFDLLRKHALEMVDRGGMVLPSLISTKYDLVANICHDVEITEEGAGDQMKHFHSNPISTGSYRVHVRNAGNNTWYEIQELMMKEIITMNLSNSETSILVYEREN